LPAKVSLLQLPVRTRQRDWCQIHPQYREWLESLGLTTPQRILELSGVVVSGHVDRNVTRVDLEETTAYLKREHRIRFRFRWRGWRAGFGFVSLSEREAKMLQILEANDLPAARWLAYGEAKGVAFLLVAGEREVRDLRSLAPSELASLSPKLARVLAKLHEAGIDQPDLLAKHFLVGPANRLTILDWQRAELRAEVSWPERYRALAALHASLADTVANPRLRFRFLNDYLRLAGSPDDLAMAAKKIEGYAGELRGRPGFRSQRTESSYASQELVRVDGETLCAIPEVAEHLRVRIDELYAGSLNLPDVQVSATSYSILRGIGSRMRGRSWRSPELRQARLLFLLEKHGLPAPKMLAYGQRSVGARIESFLVQSSERTLPFHAGDLSLHPAVRELLEQLHEVGCRLIIPTGAFGIREGRIVVADVRCWRYQRSLSTFAKNRDRAILQSYFEAGS
jgi:tRNA A-37 threonylcarbamoyl transferase component Bud32